MPSRLTGHGVIGRLGVLVSRNDGCEAAGNGVSVPRDSHDLTARQPRLNDEVGEQRNQENDREKLHMDADERGRSLAFARMRDNHGQA